MRTALAISGQRTAADAVEVARMAESEGIDEVWLTEDYVERGAFAVAGAVLASTRSVTVGIGVVNPWTRHPVLTAMETGALHELAPGRVVLGLGASNPRWMHDQLGIPFVRPLSRLRESVEVIRSALETGEVDHEGVAGTIRTHMAFHPGAVPLVLGVKGPRALALAGQISDGVLLSVLSSPAYVRWAIDQLAMAQADSVAEPGLAQGVTPGLADGVTPGLAHGVTPGLAHGVGAYVAVSHDRDRTRARERIRPFTARFLGIHGDHPITRTAGFDPEMAALFRDGWRSGEPRTDLVTEDMLDTFVVAGDEDDVRAGIARLAHAGLATAVIHDQNTPNLPQVLRVVHRATANASLSPPLPQPQPHDHEH